MSLPPSRIPIGAMDARQFGQYAASVQALPQSDANPYTPANADYVGWSVNPTGSFKYIDAGAFVILWVEADVTGTSNLTSFGVQTLPEAIRPSVTVQVASAPALDNGLFVPTMVQITTAGTLGMFNMKTSAPFNFGNFWTAAGTKGWPAGWSIMYPK